MKKFLFTLLSILPISSISHAANLALRTGGMGEDMIVRSNGESFRLTRGTFEELKRFKRNKTMKEIDEFIKLNSRDGHGDSPSWR